jgi:hypothetical protein
VATRKRLPPIGAGGSQLIAFCAKEDPPNSGVQLLRQANAAQLRRRGLVVDESELDRMLTSYAALDPGIVKALGADRLPARLVHVVGGRR